MATGTQTNQIINGPNGITFQDYISAFVQRKPKYGIKTKKQSWITRNKPLADPAIRAHLEGKYTVGCIGSYYPSFAALDFDDKTIEFVLGVRGGIGQDEDNSMLMGSESTNSYHCLFRPLLHGKPPTRYRLFEALKHFATLNNIEVYPQPNKIFRLPLGKYSKPVDYDYQYLDTWQDKLYWFNKLDEFEISGLPQQQQEFLFIGKADNVLPALDGTGGDGWYARGGDLLRFGLQGPTTRHDSQARVIYHLFRNNLPPDEAIMQTWAWVNKKHNGHSKDIIKFPGAVFKEIQRQAAWIYNNYQYTGKYPDITHNLFNGVICRADLEQILKITSASIPKSKLLFHIVKYIYPRRFKDWVSIRTGTQWDDRDKGYGNDTLRDWGSPRTVPKYLKEFEAKGILKRHKLYVPGSLSRGIKLNWDFKTNDTKNGVLHEGRSLDTWEDTIRLLYKDPQDFRALLRGAGAKRTAAIDTVRRIYSKTYSVTNVASCI